MRRANGFTLIELLVVISVIAILAAVLLPVLSRAREHGRRTKCAHNLASIGHGVQLYVDDFRGYIPATYPPPVPGQARDPTHILWDPNWNPSGGPNGLGQLFPEAIKGLEVFYCPSANYYVQKWAENFPTEPGQQGKKTPCSTLYRSPNGARYDSQDLLLLEDFAPSLALALDANLREGGERRYNHRGEFANILYADTHVEGKNNPYLPSGSGSAQLVAIFHSFADKR